MDSIANRYIIDDEIGRGGMGIVYRVHDRLSDDYVALKRMSLSLSNASSKSSEIQRDTIFSLAREFRSVASLYHPNLVSVLDYGIDEHKHPYLTMELVNEPLLITDYAKSISFDEKVRVIMQLLEGIMYLHRCNVIHRDIKPENVLVDGLGNVKLTDFGLAVNHTLSLSGKDSGISGTIAYLAPEIFQQLRQNTIQSDLFAVGIIAFEVLTGDYPFNKSNAATLLYSLIQDTPDTSTMDDRLAQVFLKAMAKNPDDRFNSATEMVKALSDATGIELPDESLRIREGFLESSQFVGRESELQQLKIALDNILVGMPNVIQGKLATTESSKGSAWLIGGEVGVGKSRLIDEIRIRSTMRGALVLHGQAYEDRNLVFGLWHNPVRKMILATEIDLLQVGVLKQIVPDIGDLIQRDIPDVPILDVDNQRGRLSNTIISLFEKIKQPVVLIMEDLQWATESLIPLKALCNIVTDYPLLIVGSYRTDEELKLPNMTEIKLDRLSHDDIETLTISILGETARDSALVDYLHKEAEGNPYFMVEIIRGLAENAGSLKNIGFATLPRQLLVGGIQEIIRRRLDRIPEWGRNLLAVIALDGRYLNLPLIKTLIQKHENLLPQGYSLTDWLAMCEEVSILRINEGEWQFEHDKLRDAILQNITPVNRRIYHSQLAEAYELKYSGDETLAIIILDHWHFANELDKEIIYLNRAARSMITLIGDGEQARHYLMRGLEQLPQNDLRRVSLLLYLSETYWRVDYQQGEKLALQALEIAKQHDDKPSIARSYFILGLMVRDLGRYQDAQSYHQQSLALYKQLEETSGIADNLRNMGIIAHDLSQLDIARDYYQQALTLHQSLNEQVKIGMTLNNLGVLAYGIEKYAEAVDFIKRGLAIAEAIGNKREAALALNNLAMTVIKMQDFTSARDYFNRSLVMNQQIENQWGIANTHINLGFMYIETSELQLAYDELMHGIRRAHEINAINLLLEGLVGIADLYLLHGNAHESASLIGTILEHPRHNDDVRLRYDETIVRLKQVLSYQELETAQNEGRKSNFSLVLKRILEGDAIDSPPS